MITAGLIGSLGLKDTFNPLDLDEALWIDFKNVASKTIDTNPSANSISQIDDLSPAGIDYSQAIKGEQPLEDGTFFQHVLYNTTTIFSGLNELFITFNINVLKNHILFMMGSFSSGVDNSAFVVFNTGEVWFSLKNHTQIIKSNVLIPLSTDVLFRIVINGTSSRMYYNGVDVTGSNTITSTSFGSDVAISSLGNDTGAINRLKGKMGDVFLTNSLLTTVEAAKATAYFKTSNGIA